MAARGRGAASGRRRGVAADPTVRASDRIVLSVCPMTPFTMCRRDCIWSHDIRHDDACTSPRFSRLTCSCAAPIPVGLCARLSTYA